MINFRFHLVSLVAVFLALGVGVAVGASFIDRATVETLRDRLDRVEDNYRERGEEIATLRDQVETLDRDTAALVEPGSALLAGRLDGTTTVVIADTTTGDGLALARAGLSAAGADDGGAVLVDMERLASDPDTLGAAREVVGLSVAAPALVRERVLSSLGDALGVLATAAEPGGVGDGIDAEQEGEGGGADGEAPTPTVDAPPGGEAAALVTDQQREEAEELLDALVSIGVVRLEPSGPTFETLLGPAPVSFVMLADPTDDEQAARAMGGLARSLARAAPAVLVVAEPTTPRPVGEAVSRVGGPGLLVAELRDDDEVAQLLSTVDHLDETVGRIALVLAVEEQDAGRVGHYGAADGATSLLPLDVE